jgi:hypothetical protein
MSDQPGIWSRPLFNLSLRGWRRLFGRYPERIDPGLRMRAIIAGCLSSALEHMQERLFGAQLDAVALEVPVFIVGHWRSGTTLLHELMALDQRLISPTTQQCFNPQSFLLSGKSRRAAAAVTRPSGDRMVSSDSPQEEEFALLCLGCTSPYEAFVFPRALDQLSALCDPVEFAALDRQRWAERLTRFLKAVTLACGPGRLLLKSPSNTFRISALRRLFPGAAFVHIVREPAPVIASTLDLWKSMWDRYALGSRPDDTHLRQAAILALLEMEKKLQDQLGACPAAFITIRYEDLVARPYDTLGGVYAALNLGRCPSSERIRTFLAGSPQLRPSPAVPTALEAELRERCAAILDRYGYGGKAPRLRENE